MDHNRIKKLLSSEYDDFYEKIIIESPFAETTRDGRGIREVTIALSSSKLIIASDIFRKNQGFTCLRGVDPSIECFELVSVYPLEFVSLSIFRRRMRKTLKARLINGRVTYYELGGIYHRKSRWSLWCSQIEVLQLQKENGSSLSETTAASSSSSTTPYILSSDGDSQSVPKNSGNPRICSLWTYNGESQDLPPSWPRKDIYLGPTYNELGHGLYAPIPVRFAGASFNDLQIQYELRPVSLVPPPQKSNHSWPPLKVSNTKLKYQNHKNTDLCDVLYVHRQFAKPQKSLSSTSQVPSHRSSHPGHGDCGDSNRNSKTNWNRKEHRESNHTLVPKLSRFGFGIHENCSSGLYLAPHEGDPDHLVKIKPAYKLMDPYRLIESGVEIWERAKSIQSNIDSRHSLKSFRRYGLATCPHLFFGLGPWSVNSGDKISFQKRSSSLVRIRRQPVDNEMKLAVSKKHLCTSVSMSSLEPEMSTSGANTRGKIVMFWTPDYWYRPRAATAVYKELRNHLTCLHNFHSDREKNSKRSFFLRRKSSSTGCRVERVKSYNKSNSILNKIFSSRDLRHKKHLRKSEEDRTVNQLRRLLKPNFKTTIWDLDSTTLAKQLTLIDRDLFLRIPLSEIEIIIFQKSSKNAPNIGAWMAFSHRISSLTSSEILMIKKLEMRTRMLARFINSANKCFSMGNFNSCRSIIAGLQSPPIYRLRSTWSYLKTHHATRYETFTRLCRVFKNCRIDVYIRAWETVMIRPPVLPYIGHVLTRILGLDIDEEIAREETPRRWTQKNYDCGCTYLYQASEEEKCVKNQLTRHTISSMKSKSQGLVRRILSNTVGRIIQGRGLAGPEKFDVFWAAKQLMVARKFFDQWQAQVLTMKIIKEYEIKRRNVDWRRKRGQEVGIWISNCQRLARDYQFPGHSLAWEFLLKARYKEDKENFWISLKLEPPLG
ncbi:uncharacterized protein [Fopius arisanus]|uniref:Ras-GEF domain-containing protein n=1 Tax=Fopius arisanus TaxID=64838 RepID=A0A9R1U3B4_9HYME|nr:PREDICTED: uncharacterized protein LOC105268754 [Fopius arisanus]